MRLLREVGTISCLVACLIPWPVSLAAQSVLERSPNLSGGWVAPAGVLQFDFVHRFDASPAPEHKVTSFPSFVLAAGLPHRTMVGFVYSTNSTLVARYPNEWEFFGQAGLMRQSSGHPLDLGVELGYSIAAEGMVGELSLERTAGRLRLLAAGRVLADPADGPLDVAVAGGAVVRLGRWVAIAGDVASVLDRAPGEEIAWSAGLQLGIPHTPHTLSLQASNAVGLSLESASRGTQQTLYGFEFTIPITLRRFFGPGAAPRDSAAPAGDSTLTIRMKNLAYGAGSLTVTAGTVVEWRNDDPLAHTVVASDGSFDSGLIEPGAAWSRRFDTPGTYAYTCRPHPFMHGTIVVVAPQ